MAMITANEAKELADRTVMVETSLAYERVCEEIKKAANEGKYSIYLHDKDLLDHKDYIYNQLKQLGYTTYSGNVVWC